MSTFSFEWHSLMTCRHELRKLKRLVLLFRSPNILLNVLHWKVTTLAKIISAVELQNTDSVKKNTVTDFHSERAHAWHWDLYCKYQLLSTSTRPLVQVWVLLWVQRPEYPSFKSTLLCVKTTFKILGVISVSFDTVKIKQLGIRIQKRECSSHCFHFSTFTLVSQQL